jgi:hypothetical protein
MVTVCRPDNPEQIRRDLEAYRRDSESLRSRLGELRGHHAGEWVAVHAGQVYHAAELDALLAALRLDGIDPAGAPRVYLATDAPVLIL